VSARCGESIAADKLAVVTKASFDAIVIEDGQRDGCLADSAGTNESSGYEVFGQIDNPSNQVVTSKTGPLRLEKKFIAARWARTRYEIMDPLVAQITDLIVA